MANIGKSLLVPLSKDPSNPIQKYLSLLISKKEVIWAFNRFQIFRMWNRILLNLTNLKIKLAKMAQRATKQSKEIVGALQLRSRTKKSFNQILFQSLHHFKTTQIMPHFIVRELSGIPIELILLLQIKSNFQDLDANKINSMIIAQLSIKYL